MGKGYVSTITIITTSCRDVHNAPKQGTPEGTMADQPPSGSQKKRDQALNLEWRVNDGPGQPGVSGGRWMRWILVGMWRVCGSGLVGDEGEWLAGIWNTASIFPREVHRETDREERKRGAVYNCYG